MLTYRLKSESDMRELGAEIRRRLRDAGPLGLSVSVEPYQPPGSNAQAVKVECMISDIARSTGHDRKALREYVRQNLLPSHAVRLHREQVFVPKSFANLTKAEASAVIDRLYELGAGLGVEWSG